MPSTKLSIPSLSLSDSASSAGQRPPSPSNSSSGVSNGRRSSLGNVQAACANCKKAHLACDNERPCRRCVAGNKQAGCIDIKHKKRGRPSIIDRAQKQQAAIVTSPATNGTIITSESSGGSINGNATEPTLTFSDSCSNDSAMLLQVEPRENHFASPRENPLVIPGVEAVLFECSPPCSNSSSSSTNFGYFDERPQQPSSKLSAFDDVIVDLNNLRIVSVLPPTLSSTCQLLGFSRQDLSMIPISFYDIVHDVDKGPLTRYHNFIGDSLMQHKSVALLQGMHATLHLQTRDLTYRLFTVMTCRPATGTDLATMGLKPNLASLMVFRLSLYEHPISSSTMWFNAPLTSSSFDAGGPVMLKPLPSSARV
eukprot:Partr_v1_DN25536_c1_g1_i2_m20808 putative GAL4